MRKKTAVKIIIISVSVLLVAALLMLGLKYLLRYLNTPDESTARIDTKSASLYIGGEYIPHEGVEVCNYSREKVPRVRILEQLGIDVPQHLDDYAAENIYAKVPLVAALENFGAECHWIDDDNATISFNSKTYELCLSESSLCETNGASESNLLDILNGGHSGVRERAEREFLIDAVSLKAALSEMGKQITVSVDYDNATVNIR